MNHTIYELDGHKYRIYQNGHDIIAVSTYGGKFVKGYAKCSDMDTFDFEKGKKLAALRCNEKIAAKRSKNAAKRADYMSKFVERAERLYNRYSRESAESIGAHMEAQKQLKDYLKTL